MNYFKKFATLFADGSRTKTHLMSLSRRSRWWSTEDLLTNANPIDLVVWVSCMVGHDIKPVLYEILTSLVNLRCKLVDHGGYTDEFILEFQESIYNLQKEKCVFCVYGAHGGVPDVVGDILSRVVSRNNLYEDQIRDQIRESLLKKIPGHRIFEIAEGFTNFR